MLWIEQLRYARDHDVLLVHAAGNDAKNTNGYLFYPNSKFEKAGWFRPKTASNWIEVGASSWKREDLAGNFSNYGDRVVDVFAPGIDMESCKPGNQYETGAGTSYAAPVVAGIAALLRSYFPSLTAKQTKECIERGVFKPDFKVKKPGTDELVDLGSLCKTGGIANAYGAVRVAMGMIVKRKQVGE